MAGLKAIGRVGALGGSSAPKIGVPSTRAQTARGAAQFRKPPVFPRGPRLLRLGERRSVRGGPGDPPPGFVTGQSSRVEWYWFWATVRALNPGRDPRRPPFVGDGVLWDYQTPDDPANPRIIGSYVSDFVYHLGMGELVVRIDTFRYHIATTPIQLAKDLWQKLHGAVRRVVVISAYDDDIVNDRTGRAAMAALMRALSGKEPVSPVRGGTARTVRDQIAGSAP